MQLAAARLTAGSCLLQNGFGGEIKSYYLSGYAGGEVSCALLAVRGAVRSIARHPPFLLAAGSWQLAASSWHLAVWQLAAASKQQATFRLAAGSWQLAVCQPGSLAAACYKMGLVVG